MTIDFLEFEKKIYEINRPKEHSSLLFRINSNLSHESMIEGEVKQDFAVIRIQVVPHV